MKKLIYLLSCTLILLQSCSSKDDANSQAAVNSSTINVKWEIIASSNVRTDYFPNDNSITITYTNSTGQQQIETTNYPNDFRNWSKTFNLTNTNRPLNLSLKMTKQSQPTYDFYIRNGGTIKFNLYLDGILTKSVTESSSSSYQQIGADKWYEIAVFNLYYIVQ
jgi:predicted GH43/DUF377 family glycosyl hydrolase